MLYPTISKSKPISFIVINDNNEQMGKRAATGGRPYTLFGTLIALGRINCSSPSFPRKRKSSAIVFEA